MRQFCIKNITLLTKKMNVIQKDLALYDLQASRRRCARQNKRD